MSGALRFHRHFHYDDHHDYHFHYDDHHDCHFHYDDYHHSRYAGYAHDDYDAHDDDYFGGFYTVDVAACGVCWGSVDLVDGDVQGGWVWGCCL